MEQGRSQPVWRGGEPEKERKGDCQTTAENHSLYSLGNRGGCPGSHASADGLRLSYSSTCMRYRKSCPRSCNAPTEHCPEYTPDFMKLAESYGANGIRVTKENEIAAALETAKHTLKVPTVIEFIIEPEENVMPIVPPGNALDDMILESGDRFFETSRAMENCLFEVNCIMGRRTIDIILFVGIIVCLIITAYTGYAAIEKLKGERADSRYLRRDCIQGIFTVSFGENFSGTIAVSLGSSFPI